MLGSAGLVTEGSTRLGPGLRTNTNGVLMENQIRAPERCGMATTEVEPGGPSGMVQLTARGVCGDVGEGG